MMRLKFIYSRIRIGIYTFALGLAAVWMYNGFLIGSEYVHVDLPRAESAEVLQVFPKKPFAGMAWGGSGPHGPHVSLYSISTKDEFQITVVLGNFLEVPIYMPRRRQSPDSVPYFMECQDAKGSPIYVIPSEFQFTSDVIELQPSKELRIGIPRPESATVCAIAVPFEEDRAAAFRLADPEIYRTTNDVVFFERKGWAASRIFELSEFD